MIFFFLDQSLWRAKREKKIKGSEREKRKKNRDREGKRERERENELNDCVKKKDGSFITIKRQ